MKFKRAIEAQDNTEDSILSENDINILNRIANIDLGYTNVNDAISEVSNLYKLSNENPTEAKKQIETIKQQVRTQSSEIYYLLSLMSNEGKKYFLGLVDQMPLSKKYEQQSMG